MLILKAEGLKKDWNGKQVFENINLEIHQGERCALIGQNGVGKTTLLGCLLGRVFPDGGKIFRRWPVKEWGSIEQHLMVPETLTIQEFVQSGHSDLYRLKQELNQLEAIMEHEKGNELNTIFERYSTALEHYQSLGGYEWEYNVEAVLSRFALSGNVPYRKLSGGQKTKAQLARVLAGNPSFLLMDEPTNHLDIETLDWLRNWIQTFSNTVLFVSHDREFIDRIADKTVELSPKGTKTYQGGYSDFFQERERERREQESLYKKQLQDKKKLEEAIHRYRDWFTKAHAAAGERNPFYKKKAEKNKTRYKAKEKALERLEKELVERPKNSPGVIVHFAGSDFQAHQLVRMENIRFSYSHTQLLHDVNFTISRGDRLAVVGPNGSGKTTLLKLLSGQLRPQVGTVTHHPALKIGYFAQELDNLHDDNTILDSLLCLPEMTQREARNILAGFLFRHDEVFRKIGSLSMGERCRVAFVALYFSGANLMVLDEPTNYLDIPTRERIEEALIGYPGALAVVSHDRYLLKKVSNRVASLDSGQLTYYPGNYEEYQNDLRKRTTQPGDSVLEGRILSLNLELTRLMTEEEPEGEDAREALYARIRAVKAELHKLKNGQGDGVSDNR
ncbi:ABC transporter [Desulfotomaculum arcticum]|uniref:ABC transporter n=1 Tax=Desulfotruncus arcticus DSM 17038 TaxID=1121424 RepID=A0A1I2R6K1_9FIRM|nr:ABC-F type ribosomal protection protein [Desulfotruncus arcticus]SFG36050.1 ABC transporter [Desulfotomaculum arcticum] [Desulfotruncus arcticus DSM 17038]